MSALGTDAARQSESIQETFAAGLERQRSILESEKATRAELINTIAHLVGAIMLSRACPDNSGLADEILDVCRTRLLTPDEDEQ